MRVEERRKTKRREGKVQLRRTTSHDFVTCSCAASGLLSAVRSLQIALLFVRHCLLRHRGGWEECILQSPGRSVKTFCQSHTCCHYTCTGPSICLILLWAHVWAGGSKRCVCVCVCEVFISSGISLPPLIPSLGSHSLIYVPRTAIALAYWEACRAPGASDSYAARLTHSQTQWHTHTCVTYELCSQTMQHVAQHVLFGCEGCCCRALVVASCRALSKVLYEECFHWRWEARWQDTDLTLFCFTVCAGAAPVETLAVKYKAAAVKDWFL